MLRHRSRRRATGIVLVVLGALMMWLAPAGAFGALSLAGVVLLVGGIVLEIVGIALEHRDRSSATRRTHR